MDFHNALVCPNRPSYPSGTFYHTLWRLSREKFDKNDNSSGRIKKNGNNTLRRKLKERL